MIGKGNLKCGQLKGKTAIVTGAGGGIGFEAARSLAWLGVKVIIAEVEKGIALNAVTDINGEFGEKMAYFVHTDVGSEKSISKLYRKSLKFFGSADIIINNATYAPIGYCEELEIKDWDRSYRTNLFGPFLLVKYFLPDMKKKNTGTLIFVSSSGAAPFMGGYEIFKTSQVELSNTLSGELENTGVINFTIGPGIVKTKTALNAIKKLAPMYGKTEEEFFGMNRNLMISVEEAGAGFAAAAANHEKYRGLEIGSIQALMDAGIEVENDSGAGEIEADLDVEALRFALLKIMETFSEQYNGWMERPVFERQWIIRDFKKHMKCSPDEYRAKIKNYFENLNQSRNLYMSKDMENLKNYYLHQIELLKGYEKDRDKLDESNTIMNSWIAEIENLTSLLNGQE